MNFFDKLLKLYFEISTLLKYYFIVFPVEILSGCLTMSFVIILILLIQRKQSLHDQFTLMSTKKNIEKVVFDYRYKIIQSSDVINRFFPDLSFDFLEKEEPELVRLIKTSINYRHSFEYQCVNLPFSTSVIYYSNDFTIYFQINYEVLFNKIPLPIVYEIGKQKITNKDFQSFGSFQSTNFVLPGEYYKKLDTYFSKATIRDGLHNFSILFPLVSEAEYGKHLEDKYDIPCVAMGILNKSGKFIYSNKEFKQLFKLEESVFNFQDFLEQKRDQILYHQNFFQEFKKHFLQLFEEISSPVEEQYAMKSGEIFSFKFIPHKGNILLLCNDITTTTYAMAKQETIKEYHEKLFNKLADIIVIFDENKQIQSSNHELISKENSYEEVIQTLKNLSTPNNTIEELNFIDNTHVVLLRNSVTKQIQSMKQFINTHLMKIIKIITLLKDTVDQSLEEYLKYIQFIIINIENKIKCLENNLSNQHPVETFDLIKDFHEKKEKLEEFLVFKNLEIASPESIILKNHRDSVDIILEQILLLAFHYQFNNKSIKITEEKTKIKIILSGIDKLEIHKIYNMFDIIKHINTQVVIDEDKEKLIVNFIFQKHKNINEDLII